jgi:aerobic-type carbon monoxide dehydrogenase small subunit (CoxS/CutS family)
MAIKTKRKRDSSASSQNDTGIANTEVSRRTMLKGGASAAAVVGVSVAMKGMRFKDSSTTTIQTNTAKASASPPIVATDPAGQRTITLNVNGKNYNVNVYPRSMLVDVLRDTMGLIATKRPCNRMECGACTVLIDGAPHDSCGVLAIRAAGHNIVTSEIATGDPVVNVLQQAWVTADGAQCGYCSPGYIMASTALLKANPTPTVADIKEALSGNLCRCGNYPHIIAAVQLAASNLGGA